MSFTQRIVDYPELQQIVRDSKASAVLYFGSDATGDSWPRSDIDLFILTSLSKEPTAFFFESRGRTFHVNLMDPKKFRKVLQDPKRLTLHSVLVGSLRLLDKTTWLASEQKRLASYPVKNRLYQVMQCLEDALCLKYKLEKHVYQKGPVPYNGDVSALAKIFEARTIDQGLYFGRSVVDSLGKSDKKRILTIRVASPSKQIAFIDRETSALLKKYLPLWIREIRRSGSIATYSKLSSSHLDLFHVYAQAERMKLLKIEAHPTRNHGFELRELCLKIKNSSRRRY